MRIVVAPDKFKGSLSAAAAAAHIAAGVRRAIPDADIVELPMADGGEGTIEAALAAGFTAVQAEVSGPLGQRVTAQYAVRGNQAVLEMASASGLALSVGDAESARWSSTAGTGELIAHALDRGAMHLVLGVGGSATTDGGAGMLVALGARLRDADGAEIGGGGAALAGLAEVDLDGLDPRLADADLVLASDVGNPLTGPQGAAAVYGPQKGATPQAVQELDAALVRWVEVLSHVRPIAAELAVASGAGAAGGLGFGAYLMGARQRPGVEVVLDLVDFASAVAGADLVITGEGSLDAQSLQGKTPVGVAAAARAAGVRTVAVAGRVAVSQAQLTEAGIDAAAAITQIEPDPARCMAEAGPLLEDVTQALVADLLIQSEAESKESG